MWMSCCGWPHWGVSRGDVIKMRLAKATLVFMQSPTGNKLVVKLLAAGGANGQDSCGAKFSSHPKYLGCYHNQTSTEYVARRFRGSRNKIPLVSWTKKTARSLFIVSFEFEDFETFWRPSHLPMSRLMIMMLLSLLFGVVLLFEYHDDLAFWVLPFVRINFKNVIACMLYYNLLSLVFVTSA